MARRPITTAGFLFGDRHIPPAAFREQVAVLRHSGVVNHLAISAQLGNFVPPQLWTTENTPMAAALPDADSVAATTPDHVRAGYLAGSPAEVAGQVRAFLDAGVSYVGLADYLPLVSPPDQHDSMVTDGNRTVACFRHLTPAPS